MGLSGGVAEAECRTYISFDESEGGRTPSRGDWEVDPTKNGKLLVSVWIIDAVTQLFSPILLSFKRWICLIVVFPSLSLFPLSEHEGLHALIRRLICDVWTLGCLSQATVEMGILIR